MFLADFLDVTYIPSRLGIQAGSIRGYRFALKSFSAWLGRPAKVADLCKPTVRAYLSAHAQKYRPATVNGKRRHLLALWRAAYDEGLLTEWPRRIAKMVEALDPPEAWTIQEIERILEEARRAKGSIAGIRCCDWMTSLLLAIYDCGARIAAVRKVQTGDVDLSARTILFRAANSKTHRGQTFIIGEDTAEAIERIYSRKRLLVWPWPYSREALDERLRAILARAGVAFGRGRGGLWHKFRRTSGSLVEAAGGDGAKHLGNSRAVFERHYLDPRLLHSSQVALLPRPHLRLVS